MKLAFVVQRYGPDQAGGAERHCRWLAQRLARRHEVEVLTTSAKDYAEWRNHYPPGEERDEGIRVTRFPVARPRDTRRFALYSDIVFRDHHTPEEERQWVVENGPYAPALVEALASRRDVELFVFYSFRYYTTAFGLPRVRERAVLVPTAEDDEAVRLPFFRELFAAPRGMLYLTPEERELVRAAGGGDREEAVVGIGVETPSGWEGVDPAARFGLERPYLLYVGRIDTPKGVDRLVDYYTRLATERPGLPRLALAGEPQIPLPAHPGIHALGVVSEPEKHALMAGCSVLLLPSALESLSLAVLEAWALGRPVLVNAECRVLEGQCVRSNGGLYYRGYGEFAPALGRLLDEPELAAAIGECGRDYVRREYAPDAVDERVEALLSRLAPAAAGRA